MQSHHRGGPRGPHGSFRGERRGHRGPNRAQRGDVRAAILLVLETEPMHGYQLIQEIATRTQDGWKPSPGAVYPTISLLEDEGLVTVTREGTRQLVSLTDEGRAYLEENREALGDPFTDRIRSGGAALRDLVEELHVAVRQVVHHGSDEQIERARAALADARRTIYLVLAGE